MLADLPVPLASLTTFALAWIVIVIVPGPTITVIVANALRAGTRAGLATVAGTQAAVSTMVLLLAFGLETIMQNFQGLLVWIKFLGAAYLVWLGVKLWRASLLENGILQLPTNGQPENSTSAQWSPYFWQGFTVLWSNPKAFVFFGAFIPQFVTPGDNTTSQVLLLGAIAMIIGTVLDGAYAVLAGRAGAMLTRTRIRWTERGAGTFLVGGGIWLALSRQI